LILANIIGAGKLDNKYIPLYRKYRPQTLQDYFGNKQLKTTVKKMLANNTLPHAILLSGNSGSGKTTLARIIAKELNCSGIDLTEFNIADTNGVDSIRDLIENANYRPMISQNRVYILDECHQMTTQAQNALLKVLEEPKPWVYFILCTTDPQKLLNTIKSRTTQFAVKPLEGEDYFTFAAAFKGVLLLCDEFKARKGAVAFCAVHFGNAGNHFR
jgi:DNA polymerase-3 subunit gamma/tau